MNNVAQSTPEGTHAPTRPESEDLHGQLLHALKIAAGGPFDETEAANAEDFAECVSGELAAELLAVAHDERGLDHLPTNVANRLVELHGRARAVHLALRMKHEANVSAKRTASAPVPASQTRTVAHAVPVHIEAIQKRARQAKDELIDLLSENEHDNACGGALRHETTRDALLRVLRLVRAIEFDTLEAENDAADASEKDAAE